VKANEIQLDAYIGIFVIENMLRFSFHNYYTEQIGNDYFIENNFPVYKSKYASNKLINIVDIVNKRIQLKDPFLDKNEELSHLWYLDLPILIELYENYWEEHTKHLFNRANKEEIITYLRNITISRNDVAHNRPINEDKLNLIQAAKIILENKMNKKYLKSIDVVFAKEPNAINDEIVSIMTDVKERINKLDLIKRIDYLHQLLSSFFILRNEEFDSSIIKCFIEYNNINRNRDFGKKTENFIISNKLYEQIDSLIQLAK